MKPKRIAAWAGGGLVALVVAAGIAGSPPGPAADRHPLVATVAPTNTVTPTWELTTVPPTTTRVEQTEAGTSQADVGSSSAGSVDSSSGASAVCKDGTLSYSRHPRGTCSRHGGVAKWL